jgi:hypothetical protein
LNSTSFFGHLVGDEGLPVGFGRESHAEALRRREGCVKDVVLTETKEGTETAVEKYRISVVTLIDLIKVHGKQE